jgi:hypothetical protein
MRGTISGLLTIGALLLLTYPVLLLGPLIVNPGQKGPALLYVAQLGFLIYPAVYLGSAVAASILRSKEKEAIVVTIALVPPCLFALACLLFARWLALA